MPITEEQRQRAEANRLAALAKRKAFTEYIIYQQQEGEEQHKGQDRQNPWSLSKCQKLSSELPSTTHLPKTPPFVPVNPDSDTHLAQKFRVRLEICSPDSFSVIPEAVQGFVYPGEEDCLMILGDCLSNVIPSHYTQNYGGGKACVYKIRDYDAVLTSLKNYRGIEIQKVPFGTLNVIQRLSNSFDTKRWEPCRPEHLTDAVVDEMIGKLPRKLLDTLLPFQIDGLRFGLQRGGRCLIADEMGLGKTLQAIAIAGCFMNEGPILVVCPAILRFSWAEELERWLPCCLPSDVHLVFGCRNNPAALTRLPKVVVISYTMLHRLQKSMLDQEWALLIVDESHHVRCSRKKEAGEVKAVLDVAAKVKRIVLLSGTPSLSRPYDIFHQINMLWPGLLGQSKYDFAKNYCNVRVVQTSEGKGFQDFSKGIRLEELNILLRQTVMIRRLKEHVLQQLPPKRRQIIRLLLKRSDIVSAKAAIGLADGNASESNAGEAIDPKTLDEPGDNRDIYKSWKLSRQELGIAKLSGFLEWLSIHPLISEPDGVAQMDVNPSSQKMLIFAHHHKVLNGVQEFICEKRVHFIRIDGNTLARDRQLAVQSFQSSNEVKIAIIGVSAGGVGLNFSTAQNVVFLELPDSPSLMLQAEDRAHRQGQTKAVNIYIFCAKDTIDETHWQSLNKSLRCVSSTTNGKYDAVPEIAVDSVSYLKASDKAESSAEQVLEKASGLLVDRRPLETHDEVARKLIDTSEGEASVALDLEIDNDSAGDGNLEENICGTEIGIHDRDSSNLYEGNGGKAQSITNHNCSLQETEIECGEPAQQNEANEECSNHVNFLRFEVSQYTGRIHLYSCNPGTGSRPQPLFENFRLEEIESLHSQNENKETCPRTFKGNPVYWHALLAFISEWNKLRPIEKRKLRGKTLQLPLTVELCYLNESINHNTGGLLKGGSKRRVTPCCEISYPLPPSAIWKKVCLPGGFGKKEKQYVQGWTVTDDPLCKLCQKSCKGGNAKTPEYFEDLFCNLRCYEEYRVRSSSRSLRQELFKIEHGICSNCQLDCHQLVRTIKPLSVRRRREYIEEVAPKLASRKKLLDKLVDDPSEANAWHADHIVPVYQGGGECNLENMRTLCVACHYEVTASQHAERHATMAKARKLLKDTMRGIKLCQEMEKVDNNFKFQGQVDPGMQQDPVEDELLVKVPGSAYSRGKDTDPEAKAQDLPCQKKDQRRGE